MKVLLAPDQQSKLRRALERAGQREIGGQLYGEQLAPSYFRVTHLTLQSRPGTIARFVVDLFQAAREALTFFDATRHQYARYNYIGEWHSHPSFAVKPSGTDAETMRELVADSGFRGSFAVLMIVRLDREVLHAGAWLFDPLGAEHPIALDTADER